MQSCLFVLDAGEREGNLFLSDEFGNVSLVAMDANKLYSVVKSKRNEPPKSKSIVVAHKGGVTVVTDANDKITV